MRCLQPEATEIFNLETNDQRLGPTGTVIIGDVGSVHLLSNSRYIMSERTENELEERWNRELAAEEDS